MREERVLALISGSEWAITSDALQGILAIAKRETGEDLQAVEARIGRPLDNTHRAEMRGSVAVIPVTGPLFRRANMFTKVSGATSYDSVAQDLRAAVENPAVKSIVLNIDSPGGMANGVAELASHIVAARSKKDVVAYVGGTGASAAYWLASAASRIVANQTAFLGSVGVVVGMGKASTDTIEIVSSQSPYKNVDPSTVEGRARIQARVDNLAAIFIAEVAANRGLKAEQVLTDFGQGDVLLGEAALRAKMIDALGTFEGLIAQLNGQPTGSQHHTRSNMETVAELRSAHPALVKQIEAEAVDAFAREHAGEVEGARADGCVSERERVIGIVGAKEAKGREALALKLAGMPAMSAADAVGILEATPIVAAPSASEEFSRVMAKTNPTIEGDDPPADDAKAEEDAFVSRVAAIDEARTQKR